MLGPKSITISLISLILLSALGVVYNKHQTRQLFMTLQKLQYEVESLQLEWSQLLLEQGTWGTDSRVEKVAREHLQMILPEPSEVMSLEGKKP